ncbi:MAG TPA: hypothetical protein VIO11_00045 [Candidatus Methanoperedens sp.]
MKLENQNALESKKLAEEKPLNLGQYRIHGSRNVERNGILNLLKFKEAGAA